MSNPFETTHVPLEALELEPMASGERSLRLSTRVTWEQFASYAPAVMGMLGGRIVERADSAPERVWTAIIEGQRFWLELVSLLKRAEEKLRAIGASRTRPRLRRASTTSRASSGSGSTRRPPSSPAVPLSGLTARRWRA